VETAAGTVFLHIFNPPLRLIVIGAVHITQPLIRMAALAGYEVSVIDPRRSFATGERFPGVTLMDEWPDDGLEALALDARTAVVTLTHDPKLDDPALEVALRSGVFYIGSLGSRRTHAARLERLTQAGFDKTALARIHGPVGLSIGAKSPAEIAISIMAQITEALRQTA
jgi:xanthine dehydrogenase accessory factor